MAISDQSSSSDSDESKRAATSTNKKRRMSAYRYRALLELRAKKRRNSATSFSEQCTTTEKCLNSECEKQQVEGDHVKLCFRPADLSAQDAALRTPENQPNEQIMDSPKDLMHGGTSQIALCNHEEMEEGEICQLCETRTDAVHLLHEGGSMLVASNHLEMVEAVARKDAEVVMRAWSSKTALADHEELEEGEIRESLDDEIICEQPTLVEDQLLEERVHLVNTVHSRRMEELLLIQKQEANGFRDEINREKGKVLEMHNLDFSDRVKQFGEYEKSQRRKFAVMQIDARNKEKELKDQWLEEAESGTLVEFFHKLALSATGFRMETFRFSEEGGCDHDLENTHIVARPSSDHERRQMDAVALSSETAVADNEKHGGADSDGEKSPSSNQLYALPMPPTANNPSESTRQPATTSHLPALAAATQSVSEDSHRLNSDSLQIDLMRLHEQEQLLIQTNKEKIHQLQLQRDKELEEVRRKYDALMEAAETELTQRKKKIERKRILIHKHLIRAKKSKENSHENKRRASTVPQGGPSSSQHQFLPLPPPHYSVRPISILAPTATTTFSSLMLPQSSQMPISVPLPTPTLASSSSLSTFRHRLGPPIAYASTPVFSNSIPGHPVSPVVPFSVIHPVTSEPRAPAPHLRSLRLLESQQSPALHNGQMT